MYTWKTHIDEYRVFLPPLCHSNIITIIRNETFDNVMISFVQYGILYCFS